MRGGNEVRRPVVELRSCSSLAFGIMYALGRAPATRTPATRVGGLRLDPRAN